MPKSKVIGPAASMSRRALLGRIALVAGAAYAAPAMLSLSQARASGYSGGGGSSYSGGSSGGGSSYSGGSSGSSYSGGGGSSRSSYSGAPVRRGGWPSWWQRS